MFKYNELSDLKDGSLVIPISKLEDGRILCIDNEGQECYHTSNEFDLRKKPEDRVIEEPTPLEPDPASEPEEIIDDSNYDGTEKQEEQEIIENEEIGETPEGFVYNDAMLKALNLKKGIFYKDNII